MSQMNPLNFRFQNQGQNKARYMYLTGRQTALHMVYYKVIKFNVDGRYNLIITSYSLGICMYIAKMMKWRGDKNDMLTLEADELK